MPPVGPPTLAQRATPHTDAWVTQIMPALDEYGARSELARFIAGADATHGQIVRWTNVFARWQARTALPSLEQHFMVEAWLAQRGRKKPGGRPPAAAGKGAPDSHAESH